MAADPADVTSCEAADAMFGCGDGTWTLVITVLPTRLDACGL